MERHLTINKLQILIMVLLVVGLIAGLILVKRQQIFKSKASSDTNQAFQSTDSNGNPLNCPNGNCNTQNLDVKVKVDINKLNQ